MDRKASTIFSQIEREKFAQLYSDKKYSMRMALFMYAVSLPAPVIIAIVFSRIAVLQRAAAIMLMVIAGITCLLVLALFYLRYKRTKMRALLEQALDDGLVTPAHVTSLARNLSYTRNRVPQQIIRLNVKGEDVAIKTFDLAISGSFAQGGEVDVLVDARAPELLLPVAYIRAALADKPAPPSRTLRM